MDFSSVLPADACLVQLFRHAAAELKVETMLYLFSFLGQSDLRRQDAAPCRAFHESDEKTMLLMTRLSGLFKASFLNINKRRGGHADEGAPLRHKHTAFIVTICTLLYSGEARRGCGQRLKSTTFAFLFSTCY